MPGYWLDGRWKHVTREGADYERGKTGVKAQTLKEIGERNSFLKWSTTPFPLIVLVDDSEFTARTLNNFLWVTFTRSDPANDVYGIGASITRKHWHCTARERCICALSMT